MRIEEAKAKESKRDRKERRRRKEMNWGERQEMRKRKR
jgi:hypothetical protein